MLPRSIKIKRLKATRFCWAFEVSSLNRLCRGYQLTVGPQSARKSHLFCMTSFPQGLIELSRP